MVNSDPWKSRKELPLLKKLGIKFDADQLLNAYRDYEKCHTWDGLGSEYASLCKTHTKLPKMFFRPDELEGANTICEMDWKNLSYQQLSLTEWDDSYSLNERKEKSLSRWDTRIAKGKPEADERWYRKRHNDLPGYFHHVLDSLGAEKTHRARFAKLLPHSKVKAHIDYDTTYGIRLHIPIITNDKCWFGGTAADGSEEKHQMLADGSVYFINPGLKHWATNEGDEERVHLIISVDSHDLIQDLSL
jgi:hypothetical protein